MPMIDFTWANGRLWWGRFEVGRVEEASATSFWPFVAGCYVKGNMGCTLRSTAERIVEEQARSYVVALMGYPGTGDADRRGDPEPTKGWLHF